MVEAFGALGAEATAAQNLGLAYHRYSDAQTISRLLLGRRAALPAIESFLGQLDGGYEKAFAAGEYGVAWGLLDVMSELGTTTPQMRQHQRMTRDEIDRRAVRGLTAYPFEDPKNAAAKVGRRGGVEGRPAHLQHDPLRRAHRRARAARAHPRRVQANRKLHRSSRPPTSSSRARINDAKVETTEKTGSETRRVVTGKET